MTIAFCRTILSLYWVTDLYFERQTCFEKKNVQICKFIEFGKKKIAESLSTNGASKSHLAPMLFVNIDASFDSNWQHNVDVWQERAIKKLQLVRFTGNYTEFDISRK